MVNESLDRNAGSFEAGFAAHAVRIDPDDFVKLGFLFRCHQPRVRQTADWRKPGFGIQAVL
jgi:hypothetical protein